MSANLSLYLSVPVYVYINHMTQTIIYSSITFHTEKNTIPRVAGTLSKASGSAGVEIDQRCAYSMDYGRRQVFIRTNSGILLIGSTETKFNEILIETFIHENVFENDVLKMAAILSRPRSAKVMINDDYYGRDIQ